MLIYFGKDNCFSLCFWQHNMNRAGAFTSVTCCYHSNSLDGGLMNGGAFCMLSEMPSQVDLDQTTTRVVMPECLPL